MKINDMVQQFEKINISKEQILSFGKEEFKRLSDKRMTANVYQFDIDGRKIEAKFSFNKEGKLLIHPKRREIKNDLGLAKTQLERLKKGEIVYSKGKLVQLDPSINNLLSIDPKKLRFPKNIDGFNISKENMENISKGKEVTLKKTNSNSTLTIKVNLLSNKGFDVIHNKGLEQNKSIDKSSKKSMKR